MPERSLRALMAVILLIPLAWLAIGLVSWLHGTRMLIPALAAWVVVVGAIVYYALHHVRHARGERITNGGQPRRPLTR